MRGNLRKAGTLGVSLWLLAPASAPGQDLARGEQIAQACAGCHGPNGNSSDPLYPILAGQTTRYSYLQLKDYKEGRRQDPDMTAVAANMSREDMLAVAAYYSEQKPVPTGFKPDEARVARGKDLANATLCTMCHQGHYQGQNEVPRVAGQHFEYVKKQLLDFKARTRTNDAGTMTSVAGTLSDEDVVNIAQHLAALY
jgi:cytochrome c553